MSNSRSAGLVLSVALALAFALTFAGCGEEKSPLVGGGDHKVTQAIIRAYSKEASPKDKGPVTLSVGERVQLRVFASWAIPSLTEETEKAAWHVSNPSVGDVDKDGVFTALRAGRTVVTAELRVSDDGAGEVLVPGPPSGTGPVKSFRDELELDVLAPAEPAPAPAATN